MLTHAALTAFLTDWMAAWNRHDLSAVLEPMADDVEFTHWNGSVVRGKARLGRVWQPWFAAHGNFRFDVQSVCVDETKQTISFEWRLDWPAPESAHLGQREIREGIDWLELRDGLIVAKRSYVQIGRAHV